MQNLDSRRVLSLGAGRNSQLWGGGGGGEGVGGGG